MVLLEWNLIVPLQPLLVLLSLWLDCNTSQFKKLGKVKGKAKVKGKGKAALFTLYNELYNEIARLEWGVGPEPLQLSAPPHWANLA